LATYTAPPSLVVPIQAAPILPEPIGGVPMGLVIIILGASGLLTGLFSISQRR